MRSVAVIGLGYVGLPLAVEVSKSGLTCVGIDSNPDVVAGLNLGVSHVDDVSGEDLLRALANGFVASSDPSCLSEADVIVICVPTPLEPSGGPDLSAVIAAGRAVSKHLKVGTLVVLESTSYPGTTDTLLRNIIEESGLIAGSDFSLAFSPERIDPGNLTFNLRNTPKVVGGYTQGCLEKASEFYSRIVDTVVGTRGTREAELAKLLENTYRHVNIALVNELAVICHELGIDIWSSIDAAKSKPFGFQAFYPGPGVGGHCIPIDPNYLAHQVRSLGYQFRFVELAQEISARMPSYVVRRAQDLLNDFGLAVRNSRVLVLGLSYKANVSDVRESPAKAIIKELLDLGAEVTVHDPFVKQFDVDEQRLSVAVDLQHEIETSSLVLLLQAHSAYQLPGMFEKASAVFDTRGVVTGANVYRL